MESMPFLHANRIFTLIFADDLAFCEVRAILDHLLARNAFSPEVQKAHGLYKIHVKEVLFQVWVSELDVIIERK